jgi:hypothetical protein
MGFQPFYGWCDREWLSVITVTNRTVSFRRLCCTITAAKTSWFLTRGPSLTVLGTGWTILTRVTYVISAFIRGRGSTLVCGGAVLIFTIDEKITVTVEFVRTPKVLRLATVFRAGTAVFPGVTTSVATFRISGIVVYCLTTHPGSGGRPDPAEDDVVAAIAMYLIVWAATINGVIAITRVDFVVTAAGPRRVCRKVTIHERALGYDLQDEPL